MQYIQNTIDAIKNDISCMPLELKKKLEEENITIKINVYSLNKELIYYFI